MDDVASLSEGIEAKIEDESLVIEPRSTAFYDDAFLDKDWDAFVYGISDVASFQVSQSPTGAERFQREQINLNAQYRPGGGMRLAVVNINQTIDPAEYGGIASLDMFFDYKNGRDQERAARN